MYRSTEGRKASIPLYELTQQETSDRVGREEKVQPILAQAHPAPRDQELSLLILPAFRSGTLLLPGLLG